MSTARRAGRGKGHTMVAAVAVIAAACAVLAVPAPVGAESAGATTRAIGTSARLSLGSVFACAVLDSGQVTCWGRGQYGRLGNGSEATIGDDDTLRDGTPVTMPGGARAVAVTSGFAHACALLDTGDVTCWGLNNLGQLGRGDGTWIGDDETITAGGTTVAFPGGQKAVAIAAGEGHTCAVLADGAVSCWGYGGYGSLGYGNTNSIGDDESVASAGTVALPGGQGAVAITAGIFSTCAILESGDVACWGSSTYAGQLGYGSNTIIIGDNETPAQNALHGGLVPLPGGASAVAIASGDIHTCVILDNDGVSCWGFANGGQLGYGNTNNIGDNETPAANPVNSGLVPLPGGQTPVSITGGSAHTCVTFASGALSCWGAGNYGELGYANTGWYGDDDVVTAAPNGGLVQLPGGQSAVTVAAGEESTCAVLRDGGITCWGRAGEGRLGYGNLDDIGDDETPAANPVNGALVPLPGSLSVSSVSGGYWHTCAVLADGRVTCWGESPDGELGYGNTNTIGDNELLTANPVNSGIVPLPGGQTATAVTSGSAHTCALLTNGDVACWGWSGEGELGYGNTNMIGDDELPTANPVNGGVVPLPGGQTAVQIDAGATHTCAILASGAVTCWGFGFAGALGYGNQNDIGDTETPATNPVNGGLVALPGGRKAVALALGDTFTCALLDNGTVTCWGLGAAGRLGYGNTDNIGDNETPAANPVNGGIVALPAGQKATDIDARGGSVCAVLADGGLTCWGFAGFATLGYGNTDNIGDNETPATNPTSSGLVQLPGGQDVLQVAVGVDHACALLADRTVSCWGYDNRGQAGYGNLDTIGDNETPAANAVDAGIVQLPGGLDVLRLAAGSSHTCAVLIDHSLTCWGDNGDAQLGFGNTNHIGDNEKPVLNPVNGGVVPLPQVLSPIDYTPLVPARLLDTRAAGVTIDGDFQAGGMQAAGSTLHLAVGGRGGMPTGSAAVTLSVAAVQPGAGGYLTVWPCDAAQPNASNLNYQSGVNTANAVITKLAADGTVCIFTSQATHLIADVVGATPQASSLTALTPARLVDTRTGTGATIDDLYEQAGQRTAASTYTVDIAGRGGVPANATTVVLNVAAVKPGTGGYLTVHPCAPTTPNSSNLNYIASTNAANLVITRLDATGAACFFTSQATDLIVDVVAFYDEDVPGPPWAQSFTPARLVDTRPAGVTTDGRQQADGQRSAGSTYTVQVTHRSAVNEANVVFLNITAVAPAATGFLTVWPCDETQPTASSLNYVAGVNRAVQVLSKVSADGTVCVFTSQNTHLIADINGATL